MKYPALLATALLGLLCACSDPGAAPQEPMDEAPPAADEEAPPTPGPPGFDIASVPVSDAPLGEFPYFPLPDGYHTTPKMSGTIERAVFPFRVGEQYIAVEGRVHQANIRVDAGRTFSTLEVEAHIDDVMRRAGAQKVFDGVIPRGESSRVLTREFTSTFSNGLCWPTEPVRTWVLHRTDRAIWVHACSYGGIGAAWVIADDPRSAPPRQDALGAAALRERMDADGRVDIAIQFESDTSRMLSGSQQQIGEIVAMLEADPGLALSVNGYTDDSGTAARNLALSRERAQTIVDELVRRGVDAGRLRAHGFGRERPVADNGTAEGRARNRRVELERI
ncbi:MAG TPA: OmpA family protein [Luteimonas sp.]